MNIFPIRMVTEKCLKWFKEARDYISGGYVPSFAEAVKEAEKSKRNRRARTRSEFCYFCRRMMQLSPDITTRPLSKLGRKECQALIECAGSTPRQQDKARRILHNLFEINIRYGYCHSNPVRSLPHQLIAEAEVQPLPWEQLCRLIRTAREDKHRACMPAMGLMLWAGIRPAEVMRLEWDCIDWEERTITLRAAHSKTGGCRHITLYPVLRHWLRRSGAALSGKICPPNWNKRWADLRAAGTDIPWQQDVLRHTFASYHVKKWHDFPRLQLEMGHRSAELLRTRYLSMRGITREHARMFWTPGAL